MPILYIYSNMQFLHKQPANFVSQVLLSHCHLVQLRRSNKIRPALFHSLVTYSCLLINSASWLPPSCLPGRNRPITSLAWKTRVQNGFPTIVLGRRKGENAKKKLKKEREGEFHWILRKHWQVCSSKNKDLEKTYVLPTNMDASLGQHSVQTERQICLWSLQFLLQT